MGRRRARVILVLLVGCIGLVLWDGYRTRPMGPRAGAELRETDRLRGQTPPSPLRFRVVTFNIRGGVGRDEHFDLSRTIRTLTDLNPDLVALNEVHGRRAGAPQDQAHQLGRMLNLPHLFAPTELRWWQDDFGNGVLSRLVVEHWQQIPLTSDPGKAPRNAVLLRLRIGERPLNVLATHTDWKAGGAKQLRSVIAIFSSLEAPAILLGDLNTGKNDEQVEMLLQQPGVNDPVAQVLKQNTPRRLDWIITKGLTTLDAGIVDIGASDHPAMWADLRLEP